MQNQIYTVAQWYQTEEDMSGVVYVDNADDDYDVSIPKFYIQYNSWI